MRLWQISGEDEARDRLQFRVARMSSAGASNDKKRNPCCRGVEPPEQVSLAASDRAYHAGYCAELCWVIRPPHAGATNRRAGRDRWYAV